jgi:hypothetical protein
LIGVEDAQREGQEERHQMAPFVEPSEIGHERVAVEKPQEGVRAERGRRLLPNDTGGVPLVFGADLEQQSEGAVAAAGLVEEGLDRLLVVFPGHGAHSGERVDALGNVGNSLQHDGLPVTPRCSGHDGWVQGRSDGLAGGEGPG